MLPPYFHTHVFGYGTIQISGLPTDITHACDSSTCFDRNQCNGHGLAKGVETQGKHANHERLETPNSVSHLGGISVKPMRQSAQISESRNAYKTESRKR